MILGDCFLTMFGEGNLAIVLAQAQLISFMRAFNEKGIVVSRKTDGPMCARPGAVQHRARARSDRNLNTNCDGFPPERTDIRMDGRSNERASG